MVDSMPATIAHAYALVSASTTFSVLEAVAKKLALQPRRQL